MFFTVKIIIRSVALGRTGLFVIATLGSEDCVFVERKLPKNKLCLRWFTYHRGDRLCGHTEQRQELRHPNTRGIFHPNAKPVLDLMPVSDWD